MSDLKIITVKGKQLLPYTQDIAKLRIRVFKDYPYLYDGDFDYEYNYLQTYVNAAECVTAIALDGEKVIGVSTSIPLADEVTEFQQPFKDSNRNVKDYFYFGESILLLPYRGQGIYPEFFAIREKAAREYGAVYATFAVVERLPNDKRKPEAYTPLDAYWNKIGYEKHSEISTHFEWKELGEKISSPKKMVFWIKKL